MRIQELAHSYLRCCCDFCCCRCYWLYLGYLLSPRLSSFLNVPFNCLSFNAKSLLVRSMVTNIEEVGWLTVICSRKKSRWYKNNLGCSTMELDLPVFHENNLQTQFSKQSLTTDIFHTLLSKIRCFLQMMLHFSAWWRGIREAEGRYEMETHNWVEELGRKWW